MIYPRRPGVRGWREGARVWGMNARDRVGAPQKVRFPKECGAFFSALFPSRVTTAEHPVAGL